MHTEIANAPVAASIVAAAKVADLSPNKFAMAVHRHGIVVNFTEGTATFNGTRFVLPTEFDSKTKVEVEHKNPYRWLLARLIERKDAIEETGTCLGEIIVEEPKKVAAPAARAKMGEAEAKAEAVKLFGEKAEVWTIAKGECTLFRVGHIAAEGEKGRSIEDGKKMIGAGASWSAAVNDAKKRHGSQQAAA